MIELNDVRQELMKYFQEKLLYSESVEEINADESLIDSGYIDSIGIIGLIVFIEKTFNITVHDYEIIPENFDSINNLLTYLNKKVEESSSAGIGR